MAVLSVITGEPDRWFLSNTVSGLRLGRFGMGFQWSQKSTVLHCIFVVLLCCRVYSRKRTELGFVRNRLFASFPRALYQNEGKCSAFNMKILFHSHAYKIHFHMKGCALGLILKVRVFGTRKWPIMHQSIPAASIPTSRSSPHPPPATVWPTCISIFFLPWMAKFPGAAGTLLSCQMPRSGKEKRRQIPRPQSTLQQFLLLAQSGNAALSILTCDFSFQLMSAFVIVRLYARQHHFIIL